MESQMVRPEEQDPYQVHDPDSAMEGSEQPEKKSVLKKVKAKAKKIKDTITKHGQSQGQGHNQDNDYHDRDNIGDRIPDDHDLDQEDDEDDDDQLTQEPEVHGAPMYESEKVATPMNTPLSSLSDKGVSDNNNNNNKESVDPSWTFVPGTDKVNLGRPKGLEEDPHAPHSHHTPSNYETKVTDPSHTGGEETGITPILRSFGKIHLEDQPKPESNQTGTGSHDQFSPQPQPTPSPTNLDTIVEPEPNNPPTYTDKISAATSAITDKALTAKNVVASKLGYGDDKSTVPVSTPSSDNTNKPPSAVSSATSLITDKAITAKNAVAAKLGYGNTETDGRSTVPESTPGNSDTAAKKPASATATEYGKKIAATVYDKAAEIGTTVKSKIPGSATTTAVEGKESEGNVGSPDKGISDKGVSVREYLAEKLRPGEDDKALSEAISDAVHKRKSETEDGSEKTAPPVMGKVTESEEVKRGLGEDGGVDQGSGGYVEKVKGTFSSWLSFGDKSNKNSSPKSTSQGEEVSDVQGKEERKLQESGN